MSELNGIFFDGESPIERACSLRFGLNFSILEIYDENRDLVLRVHRDRIPTQTIIGNFINFNYQGKSFQFSKKDWQHLGLHHQSSRFKKLKSIGLYSFYILLLLAGLTSLRELASKKAHIIIPDIVQLQWGKVAIKTLGKEKCNDPEKTIFLNKLLSPSLREGEKVEIIILDSDRVNAFAVMGGQMVLTTKFFKFIRSPNELLGVMLHELGHLRHHHPSKGMFDHMALNYLFKLTFGGNGNYNEDLFKSLIVLKESRDDEREADLFALTELQKRGLSGHGAADFFIRIESPELLDDEREFEDEFEIPNLLSTHPGNNERIKLFRGLKGKDISLSLLEQEQWEALARGCSQKVKL